MTKRNKRRAILGWMFAGMTLGLCGSGLVALAHDMIGAGCVIMLTMCFTALLAVSQIDRVRDTLPLGEKSEPQPFPTREDMM